ncbi:hypothetical protein AJ88_25555 [Mesorhizobium amorphae CCBAU 01583]|nr:hypothetical protein AJ88_25555 [Mesorhizobium amorphae CCBAU 01583]
MLGKDQSKLAIAKAGDTVALGKLDTVKTGETLSSAKGGIKPLATLAPPQPVFAFALRPKERKDEVKMSAAIQRLAEEDPSLSLRHNQDSAETCCRGMVRCICVSCASASKARTRSRSRATHRPCPTARRSANRRSSVVATRSSQAATASSAMW